MAILDLSEKAQVLAAALHLPEFTVQQLTEISGVKEQTVQGVVSRSKDLIEPIGQEESDKPGGRRIRYRLLANVRRTLQREAAVLANKLHAHPQERLKEKLVSVGKLLDSAEAFAQGATADKASARDDRIGKQLALAKKLLATTKDGAADPFRARMAKLEAGFAKSPKERSPVETSPVMAPVLASLRQLMESFSPTPARDAVQFQHPVAEHAEGLSAILLGMYVSDAKMTAMAPAFEAFEMKQLRLRPGAKDYGHQVSVLFQEALQQATADPVLIIAMDSDEATGAALVGSLLQAMQNDRVLTQALTNKIVRSITFIDSSMNPNLVFVDQQLSHVHYLPNISNAQSMKLAVAGVVGRIPGHASWS